MTTGTFTFTQSNGAATGFTSLAGLTVPLVVSNQLSSTTGGTQYAAYPTSVTLGPDMRIGITNTSAVPGSSSSLQIFCRLDTSANGYAFEINAAAWFIKRLDAGVPTQLQTGSRTSAANDLVEIEFIGSNLKCYINGAQIGTTITNQSSYASNTLFGIFLLRNTGTLTADGLAYTDEFAPNVPTSVVATAQTGAAGLSWTAPAAGGAPTDYLIQSRIGTYPATQSQAAAPAQLTTMDNVAGTAYVRRWNGDRVTMYVIGGGIRGTHNEFTGRLGAGYAVAAASGADPFTDNTVPNVTPSFPNGHDTAVASVAMGTTYGGAKSAIVYPITTITGAESVGADLTKCIPAARMIDALDHVRSVAQAGRSVVIFSNIGFASGDTDYLGGTITAGNVTDITAAWQKLCDMGIPCVIAAGNQASDTYGAAHTPMNIADCFIIGNLDAVTQAKSTTSNFGSNIDYWAVGSGTGTDSAAATSNSAATGAFNGTSESAPGFAAVLANIMEAAAWSLPSLAGLRTILDANVMTASGSVGAGSTTKLANLNSDPATWTTFADGTSTAVSATVTGLAGLTSYTFRVASFNASGTSAYVESNTIVTLGVRIPAGNNRGAVVRAGSW